MRSMPPTGCIIGAAWSTISLQCMYSRQKSAARSSEKPRTGFRTPGEVMPPLAYPARSEPP